MIEEVKTKPVSNLFGFINWVDNGVNHSNEALMLEISASKSLYGGQFKFSTRFYLWRGKNWPSDLSFHTENTNRRI